MFHGQFISLWGASVFAPISPKKEPMLTGLMAPAQVSNRDKPDRKEKEKLTDTTAGAFSTLSLYFEVCGYEKKKKMNVN